MVFLCHKCDGVLSGDAPSIAYNCGCMSGYVRDFYTPVRPETVIATQQATMQTLLSLYDRQGRDACDVVVVAARATLARLCQGENF